MFDPLTEYNNTSIIMVCIRKIIIEHCLSIKIINFNLNLFDEQRYIEIGEISVKIDFHFKE